MEETSVVGIPVPVMLLPAGEFVFALSTCTTLPPAVPKKTLFGVYGETMRLLTVLGPNAATATGVNVFPVCGSSHRMYCPTAPLVYILLFPSSKSVGLMNCPTDDE